MIELDGWLLDIYAPSPDDATTLTFWFLGEDGRRYCLHQSFPVTFYAAGPAERLRELWQCLQSQPAPVQLSRTQRRDLFSPKPRTLLAVQVQHANDQPRLFQRMARAFPDLTYYDADIPLALRYAAHYGTFPLARCTLRFVPDETLVDGCPACCGRLVELSVRETPWELESPTPPLRILYLEPDTDPARRQPRQLLARCGRQRYTLSLCSERPLLINLRAILDRHDPDLLLAAWGDTWTLPYLIDLAAHNGLPLPLNRDPSCSVAYRRERSYFSYGQVVYRGKQVLLFGRCHIDGRNAMMWDDYDLDGVLETARVTALPLQTAARVSPGTGISAMQMLTALRQGILVPWHKQQAEFPKAALDLFASDQGGLVYQPVVGLHSDVGEIDFVSMYPGVMVRFNISPETVGGQRPRADTLTPFDAPAGQEDPGLVPQTLAPLVQKRLAFKMRLNNLPAWDPRRKAYKARASAHKWLLVTCFGYLGYKNARFGRIEAHEAVTAYGREALLRAKEVAEDLGFTVLHMYVDGLWVKKPGAKAPADFQLLLDEISRRTGLPIALDGVFRWVAFLSSRLDKRVPVANRYFGVFQDGSLKVRGVEARRHDAPAFVADSQMHMLEVMAGFEAGHLVDCLPRLAHYLRRRLADLRAGRIPLEDLVVGQRLSRELEEYHTPSPAARAAAQLKPLGRSLRPGQRVRFIFTIGDPGVYAWDLPDPPRRDCVDVRRYTTLLLRSAVAVLEPLGINEIAIRRLVLCNAVALELPLGGPAACLPPGNLT